MIIKPKRFFVVGILKQEFQLMKL